MSKLLLGLWAVCIGLSCAPVKFSKSDNFVVGDNNTNATAVVCSPKINSTATTYTYSGTTNPSIVSQCTPANVTYEWIVKRSDSSIVATTVPGLTGKDPSDIDFRTLGTGSYYVFLTATDSSGVLTPFVATSPLEFVVPGGGMGNSLTCDPKLNSTFTSVVVGSADANPTVAANCNPVAGMYMWEVYKGNEKVTISGLSGANSTPDFKAFGTGEYRVYLYATATGSAHWKSSSPLIVNVTGGTPNPSGAIQCSPRINGSLTSLTLTSSSSNPLISANCNPSTVQYSWSVTRNGQTVTVPGLAGSNSNPNFLSLGVGTYQVYLTATSPNYSSWNSTTPLVITVDGAPSPMTLNCSPRLNGTAVAVSITTAGPNPTVTSGCNPTTATHSWTVYRGTQAVTIAGLAGASSVPGFAAAGLGTYNIYLTATAPGYNTYVSPSPLVVTVGAAPVTKRRVILDKVVETTGNKVDILLVVDDSNSMLADNRKLAQKLQGFVSDLTSSGIDWKMCTTVTRAQDVNSNGVLYWGASRNWVGYVGSPQWVMKTGATDPNGIFTNTIEAIGAGWENTDDERGIKAAYWHAEYAEYNSCYRNGASLSMLIISDEDERSVGGDASKVFYNGELKTLEGDDLPQSYVNKVKQKFGNDKRFTVNSIIVKPADTACMAAQDADGAKSHYGYKYSELSQLTGGYVGSICASDYSQNLNYFKDRIVSSMASIVLECAPVGSVTVSITPSMGTVSTRIENNNLIFSPAIPAGRSLHLEYDCSLN